MNLRYTTILICLMSSPLLSAPAIEDDDTPRPPDKTELKSPVVTVPFDADASRPTIEAKINGKGPFRFILDTGAQGMLINADLAKELNLKATGKSHMGDPSDPEAIEVDRVRLDSVSIGDAVLTGVNANSWEQPAAFRHSLSNVRGIIGLTVLADCLVTFDYANNEMRLTRGELPPGVTELATADWLRYLGRIYSATRALLPLLPSDAANPLIVDPDSLPDVWSITRHFQPSLRWKRVEQGGVLHHLESSFGPEA
ncbi:MAG: clan AA aspartic protease, partial [Planctomycetes bacterium]|nr:clan AA aspartic protease [Planctomycetota bacterium]